MKRIIYNIEEAPRELQIEKCVLDVIKDYIELDTKTEFTLITSDKELHFTSEEFNREEDNLTRKDLTRIVEELVIQNYVLNTGKTLNYQDENGVVKSRIEKLNTLYRVKMTCK